MTRLVSNIYHLAHSPSPVGVEAERRNMAVRAEVWHKLGVAVLDPEDIADDWLRRAIISEAERRFGRRGRARP